MAPLLLRGPAGRAAAPRVGREAALLGGALHRVAAVLAPVRHYYNGQQREGKRSGVFARTLNHPAQLTVGSDVSRPYREQLYGARRVSLALSHRTLPLTVGLSKMNAAMRTERIYERVRARRIYMPPGLVSNLERIKSRKARFQGLVTQTISNINDIYARIK